MRWSEDERPWERIYTAFDEVELHLITGILSGEGITYRVKSGRVSQLPFSHSTLGAVEIYVPRSMAPLAKRILLVYRNRSTAKE